MAIHPPAGAPLHVLLGGARLHGRPAGPGAGRREHLLPDPRWWRVALALETVALLAALQQRRPAHPLVLDPVLEVLCVLADGGGGDDDAGRLLGGLGEPAGAEATRWVYPDLRAFLRSTCTACLPFPGRTMELGERLWPCWQTLVFLCTTVSLQPNTQLGPTPLLSRVACCCFGSSVAILSSMKWSVVMLPLVTVNCRFSTSDQ